MSVDAQPRKRKDKRKNKKDERSDSVGGGAEPVLQIGKPPPSPTPTDEMMHVHKETKVGGSVCTKIIFFLLMSGITATIVLFIVQHRHVQPIVEEKEVDVDTGWSLGDWIENPFAFGSDGKDDHQEAHSGEEVEHDEHEEHEEHEEHDEHEEQGEHEDEHGHESHDDSPGFLSSWFSGWGESAVEEHAEVEEGEHEEEEEADREDVSHEVEDDDELDHDEEDEEDKEIYNLSENQEDDDEEDDDDQEDDNQEDDDNEEEEEGIDEENKDQEIGEDDIDPNDDDDMLPELDDEIDGLHYEEDEPDDDDEDDKANSIHGHKTNYAIDDNIYDDVDEDDNDTFQNEDDIVPLDNDISNEYVDGIPFSKNDLEDDNGDENIDNNDLENEDDSNELDNQDEDIKQNDALSEENIEEDNDIDAEYQRMLNDHVKMDDIKEPKLTKRTGNDERRTEKKVAEEEKEEDSGEELFPEAVEALKLEAEQLHFEEKEPEEEFVGIEDDIDDQPAGEEEVPLEDAGEEEAQGMTVKLVIGVALVFVAHIVLVRKWNSMEREAERERVTIEPSVRHQPQQQQHRAPPKKEEAVKKQEAPVVSATAPKQVSQALKQEVPKPAPVPIKPVIPVPVPIVPPPSLTPEPSDEEELSEQDIPQNYSEGEDEEVEEEEEIDADVLGREGSEPEESPEPSDDGGEAVLPESEPEVEEEEVEEEEEEEEESEDEPVVIKKKGSTPPPRDLPKPRYGRSGPQAYENEDITNDYDWNIKEELDMADEEFNRHPGKCEMIYKRVLEGHPESARGQIGLARCLDHLADKARSNKLLEQAISVYLQALKTPKLLTDKLFLDVANRTINRIRFRGRTVAAVEVHDMIINRFPHNPKYRNDLAISFLMLNKLEDAKKVFQQVLSKWPANAIARTHFGLALKLQGKYEESIKHLEEGLLSDDEGIRDARLYFHLGDALVRTGSPGKAEEIYEKGVERGLFRSKYQRSLYNVDSLEAKPWWTLEETSYYPFLRKLEANWKMIREEALKAINIKKGFLNEAENLRDTGDWKQFEMFSRGQVCR